MSEHKDLPLGENHTPYQWAYADAAARAAAVIVDPLEIDKIALQRSDNTLWRLATVAPATWAPVMAPQALSYAGILAALGFTPEDAAKKGAANGYAPLGADQKVPAANLPGYVDDVLEYADLAAFPAVGETGKQYVALDTNKTYRWSGTEDVEISASPGSTDAVTEGAINLYFTGARVLAVVLAGLSTATNAAVTAADSILVGIGKLQAQINGYAAAALTFTNKTLSNAILTAPKETVTLTGTAATGALNVDAITNGELIYNVNATLDFTLNFRGDAGNSLASSLAVGEQRTVVVSVKNGATAYKPTAYSIDGGAVTPLWNGGVAPAAGTINGYDSYSFTFTKLTAGPTYLVRASQAKFS